MTQKISITPSDQKSQIPEKNLKATFISIVKVADKANNKAGKSRDTSKASHQLYVSLNNLHHEIVIYVRDVKAAAHRCGGKTLKFCYRKVKRVISLIKTYGVPFVCQKSLDPCKKLNLIVSEQI